MVRVHQNLILENTILGRCEISLKFGWELGTYFGVLGLSALIDHFELNSLAVQITKIITFYKQPILTASNLHTSTKLNNE
jgi:hypothetical protein